MHVLDAYRLEAQGAAATRSPQGCAGGFAHGAAAFVTSRERGRVRVCEHAHDRNVRRSVVRGEGLNGLSERLRSCDPDGSDRDIHGCEVPSMALVDGAIEALLLAKALRRPGANSDADVGRMSCAVRPRIAAPSRTHSRARAPWSGSIQFSRTPSPIAPPRRHRRGRIAATMMRVASGSGVRGSATARRSGWTCRESASEPIPSHSLAGSSPRRSTSAAIRAGG
jgi:hypothetical protein